MKGFLMKYLIFCSFLIACSVSLNPGEEKINNGNESKNPGEERINNRNESKAVIAITAGFYHTCVILIDKSVKCSGNNAYGQTGGGTSSYDRTISGTEGDPLSGKTATHIAAGGSHTCAILTNKSVKCWGSNEYRSDRRWLSKCLWNSHDKRNGRRSLIGKNRYPHCGGRFSHLCDIDK